MCRQTAEDAAPDRAVDAATVVQHGHRSWVQCVDEVTDRARIESINGHEAHLLRVHQVHGRIPDESFDVVDELVHQSLHGLITGPGDVRRQQEIRTIQ